MFGKKESQQEPDGQYFCIFDTKAGMYREPLLVANKLVALRQLENMMKKKDVDNEYYSNAEDFQLFKVADYYKRHARIESCNPEHIANFHDIKSMALRESQ